MQVWFAGACGSGRAGGAGPGRAMVRGGERDWPVQERGDGARRFVRAGVCADVTAAGGHGPRFLRDGGRVKTIPLPNLGSCRNTFLPDFRSLIQTLKGNEFNLVMA